MERLAHRPQKRYRTTWKACAEALRAGRRAPWCVMAPLTGASPTSAGGQGAAPLAIAPTLGARRALQQVAGAAGEVHHVVQVELAAIGQPVGGVPWVSTGDGYGERQAHMVLRRPTSHYPHLEFFMHAYSYVLNV